MKKDGNKLKQQIVNILHVIVNFIIIGVISLLFLVSFYSLWDTRQLYKSSESKQFEIYKPEKVDTTSYEDLVNINDEVIGWLDVFGTKINYPLVQSENNAKYVNTNVYNEYELSGSIFLDYRNNPDFTDFNNIIYGHHMANGSMFGDLEKFSQQDFFEEHAYGNLFFNGKEHGLEIISYFHTDAYNREFFTANIKGEEQQRNLLELIQKEATYLRSTELDINDRYVLLTTCSSATTNGRDIVVAKITDTPYENTFVKEKTYTLDQVVGENQTIIMVSISIIILVLCYLIFIKIRERRKK